MAFNVLVSQLENLLLHLFELIGRLATVRFAHFISPCHCNFHIFHGLQHLLELRLLGIQLLLELLKLASVRARLLRKLLLQGLVLVH
jgi:hypothetical protein